MSQSKRRLKRAKEWYGLIESMEFEKHGEPEAIEIPKERYLKQKAKRIQRSNEIKILTAGY